MTGTNVLDDCWQILQDTDEPRKFYPAEKLLPWVNEAVERIRQRRPDSMIATGGASLRTITALTAVGGAIGVADRWKTAIVDWVVARAFQTDAEDEGDQKQAALHLQLFKDAVGR